MAAVRSALVLLAALWFIPGMRGADKPRNNRAQITFHVADDSGQPVSGVEVVASAFHHWEPGEGFGNDAFTTVKGISDGQGSVVLGYASPRDALSFASNPKPGYYGMPTARYRFTGATGGRWQPWNPTVPLTIKRVRNPIPLYARKIGWEVPVMIPVVDREIGFDLLEGDWVAPHGRGRTSDLIFLLREVVTFTEPGRPFDYVLVVSFSNAGDGIQSAYSEASELRLPYLAPETGYAPRQERRLALLAEGSPMIDDARKRDDQNYFIRVRTVLDDQGRTKSALYAKIAGDFQFAVTREIRFTYYLNPVPLDRNLEFDPQRNLFRNLAGMEKVSEP